jgi:hypothetical protein
MFEKAIENGQLEMVRNMVQRGADVNKNIAQSPWVTPLATAAARGHTNIVRFLLSMGAVGKTEALANASEKPHQETMKALLAAGADGEHALRLIRTRAGKRALRELMAMKPSCTVM